MKITKFEQSGFILENKEGETLAIDIGSYTSIEKLSPKKLYMGEECIDALGKKSLKSEVIQVSGDDVLNVGKFEIRFFEVDHGPNISMKPKQNFGFLITADGEQIYFAGDMFYESGIDVSNLKVDYALIPVGAFYTFGPEEAVFFAKKFKNIKNVVPMHSRKDVNVVNTFLELADKAGLKTEDFGIL